MNFDEFRQTVKRTMPFAPELRACAGLGLVGEIGEWLLAPVYSESVKEAGDALFYHGWLCEFYHVVPTVKDEYMKTDVLLLATMIADMVKKEVFHDKPMNRKVLADHLSDIYSYFVGKYGDDGLSDIYQANIAKLLVRHPIDKGYTNEGQNTRADEIIAQCNPCACDRGTIQYSYDMLPDKHGLNCSYCGFGTFGKDVAMAIEKWNSVNIDAPVVLDPCVNCGTTEHIAHGGNFYADYVKCDKCGVHIQSEKGDTVEKWNARQTEIRTGNATMRHLTEHAQSGNSELINDKIVRMAIKTSTSTSPYANTISHVAHQVPTLPQPQQPVLLWIGHRWIEARYNGHGLWVYDSIYGYSREVKDGQYWQHLPTFNPESE